MKTKECNDYSFLTSPSKLLNRANMINKDTKRNTNTNRATTGIDGEVHDFIIIHKAHK